MEDCRAVEITGELPELRMGLRVASPGEVSMSLESTGDDVLFVLGLGVASAVSASGILPPPDLEAHRVGRLFLFLVIGGGLGHAARLQPVYQ